MRAAAAGHGLAASGLEAAAPERPGFDLGRPGTLHGTDSSAGSLSTAATGTHPASPNAAASGGVLPDAAGVVRSPAESQAANLPATARAGPAAEAPRETFAALDAGPAPGAPTWTHAGPRQAEAGFQDPALGWVGVRAEMSGGAVHAAVVPGSAEASEVLGRHMEALHTYLSEQHTPVGSLGLAAPGGRGADSPPDEGLSRQMSQNMQHGQGGSGQQQAWAAEARPALGEAGIEGPVGVESPALPAGMEAVSGAGGLNGTHISLMA